MSLYTTLSKIPGLKKNLYNLLYRILARRQRRTYTYEVDKLKSLKGYHEGQTCFIIGTGPSLKVEDLMRIEKSGIPTFAPNRIYEICEKSDWHPTYYICQDHNIIQKFGERIKTIPSRLSFLPVEYIDNFKEDKYRFFVLRERDFYPGNAKFSKDISRYLEQGYTVTYGAIQLAAYMGFKTIYLIGIDHNYSITRDSKGRPVRKSVIKSDYSEGMTSYVNQNNLPRIEESTIAYETAEKFAKRLNVKIYNATRGGKLEAFERVDIDQILKN